MPRRLPAGPALFAHDAAIGPLVAGADEAGRGALAGPLVGAAVLWDHRTLTTEDLRLLERLDDSKRLRAAVRQELAAEIRRLAAAVVVVAVGPSAIDAAGIQRANLHSLGAALAVCAPDPAERLVDGFHLADGAPAHRRLVRGDSTSAAIAAASVIAKTERDRLMEAAGAAHPGYGLETHMGYPTAAHREAIRRLGPSPVHRRSFCRRILDGRQEPGGSLR